ncbi:hypothetical protein DL93DRAFT_2074314 [Clavulina sp. PMI_390]|nr:hypothetical protein DL93DRAFT_2074314 [Clavulina sp. PMI_390]
MGQVVSVGRLVLIERGAEERDVSDPCLKLYPVLVAGIGPWQYLQPAGEAHGCGRASDRICLVNPPGHEEVGAENDVGPEEMGETICMMERFTQIVTRAFQEICLKAEISPAKHTA